METCSTHNKPIIYYCFNPSCTQQAVSCMLCLKNNHHKCPDDLVVDKNEVGTKLNILENQIDPKVITNRLNQILELKLFELNKSLMNKKQGFIKSFNLDEKTENLLDPEFLKNVKKNYNFNFNKETNKVEISSKFNVGEQEINDAIGSFEKNLEKKILDFLDEFQKLKFFIKGTLNIEDFVGHPNIELSQAELGIQFKRKPEDQSFNYFTCVGLEPLEKCIFKVHVEAVYESDRFVDVGIMPVSKWEQTKNGFINSFSSGGISYCGYSHGGGVTGNYPTTSASSTDGLKPGDHFYMSYEPGVLLKFYNDQGTVDLKLDMTGKTEDYYLFCVVYHPQTIYTLEKIE